MAESADLNLENDFDEAQCTRANLALDENFLID
ncbi:hypothetical protein CB4_02954 [Aneurinibacillus soli]|uniref:Uncharacterized protein n=1 Tax=Aneurinibacillus soli TaxID=1500254 RepID=A0A0U4WJT8_9BACL|nr:hypothetical protein CB4_02954 [Aneurinibacillus soli]